MGKARYIFPIDNIEVVLPHGVLFKDGVSKKVLNRGCKRLRNRYRASYQYVIWYTSIPTVILVFTECK